MKTHRILPICLALLFPHILPAIDVRTQPDDNAPVIMSVDRIHPSNVAKDAPAPDGWTAIYLPGPHTVYVLGKDFMKNNEIRPGSGYYMEPRADAPILAFSEKTDESEVTDLLGKWTQISLNQPFIAYIKGTLLEQQQTLPPAQPAAPQPVVINEAPATTPAPVAPPPVINEQPAAAPEQTPPALTAVAETETQPAVTPVPAGHSAVMLRGVIESTRGIFRFNQPYDYQLKDSSGRRIAYLDFSKYTKYENRLGAFIGRAVVVHGLTKPIAGSKDAVIEVQTIQNEILR